MMTVNAEQDLMSLGCLASQFKVTVRAIENACVLLGLGSGWRINGVVHLDGAQQERLAEHFRGTAQVGG